MKYSSIAEINDLEDKQPILHFKGVIKSAFEPVTGTGDFGPYKFQNAVLTDDTGEIKANFGNLEQDLRNYIGSEVDIHCSKSEQHGFTGVVVDEYKNKKTGKLGRQIKVTKSAEIHLDETVPVPISSESNSNNSTDSPKTDYAKQAKETKESYEKQAALKAAVDFVTAVGMDASPDNVVKTAKAFYGFFTND